MKNIDYAKISSDNIRALLKHYNISIKKLAETINVPTSTFTDSLKSKKGIPIDTLIKVADYFQITVTDLCNTEFLDNYNTKILPDNMLINKYKDLDTYGKRIVNSVLEIEYERCNPSEYTD